MKRSISINFCFKSILYFIIFSSFQNSKKQQPIAIAEIRNHIVNYAKTNNKIFDWKEANDHMLHSALIQSDSIAVVGYKPIGLKEVRKKLKKHTNESKEWQLAKKITQNTILKYYKEKYGSTYSNEQIILSGISDKRLPHFYIKIFDYDIINKVRNDKNIRYIEPANFKLSNNSNAKKVERKCGDDDIHPRDKVYVNEHCDYHSWSFIHHNIPQAWDVSTQKGQGIKVAVLDEGISQSLIDDFNKGESSGRTFEGQNELSNCTNQESDRSDYLGSCTTHATKVAGVIAGPKTNEGDAFGIAYRSNLKHYKVAGGLINVVIGSCEVRPVTNALMDAIDSNVKIINMSIGTEDFLININSIEDALAIINKDTEILVFAAAGSISNRLPIIGGLPVVYPATSEYTKAVTGITIEGNICSRCHDGRQVDFAAYVKNEGDRNVVAYGGQYVGLSSVATATLSGITALLWAENPDWSREEIVSRLEFASTNISDNPDRFKGVVDAYKALTGSSTHPYIDLNLNCEEPTIVFYEGNNATQDIVCIKEIIGDVTLDFHDDSNSCDHDEVRSIELYNFPKGKTIRLYNDRNADINQAWMEIKIVNDISEKVISSFQNDISDYEIDAKYFHKPGTDGLDGKVSLVDIFDSPPIPIFVCKKDCQPDLNPNCQTFNYSINNNSITISNLVISNDGDYDAIPYQIGYYLSTTNYISGNSYLIGTQKMPPLLPDNSTTIPEASFSITSVPNNQYYVIAVVDYLRENDDASFEDNYCISENTVSISNSNNCNYTITNNTNCEAQIQWTDNKGNHWSGAIIQPYDSTTEQINDGDYWAAFNTLDNSVITPNFLVANCSSPIGNLDDSLCNNQGCNIPNGYKGNPIDTQYEAESYIISPPLNKYATIKANAKASFDAGNYIDLLPGFTAEYNSRFDAFIDGCGGISTPKISNPNTRLMLRNYPNPFTGETTIEFDLRNEKPVTLFVTDMMGKKVATLLNNEQQPQGIQTITFNGKDHPPGMYYYTIQVGDDVETQKMVLMR